MKIPKQVKSPFYKLIDYIIRSDHFRDVFTDTFKDVLGNRLPAPVHFLPSPYAERIKEQPEKKTASAPIFITARFRSGSSFFWQLFRSIETLVAYYEPLNENCWFMGGDHVTDPSHIGIKNYDAEYKGLEYLARVYQHDWPFRNLHMTGWDHDRNLYTYIHELIAETDRRAVLQFNRMDFRLHWLRSNFPQGKIVHLFRHPREQWMSIQKDGGPVSTSYRYRSGDRLDLFYLINWADDLKTVFPFLEPSGQHPYAIHYYIWYLSFLYGRYYADLSIRYERLVGELETLLPDLMAVLDVSMDAAMMEKLVRLNTGKTTYTWPGFADIDWFENIEARCEETVKRFLESRHDMLADTGKSFSDPNEI